MRAFLLASLVVAADGGVPEAPSRAVQYTEARRAFARALGSGALDEARAALRVRRAAAPGRTISSAAASMGLPSFRAG